MGCMNASAPDRGVGGAVFAAGTKPKRTRASVPARGWWWHPVVRVPAQVATMCALLGGFAFGAWAVVSVTIIAFTTP